MRKLLHAMLTAAALSAAGAAMAQGSGAECQGVTASGTPYACGAHSMPGFPGITAPGTYYPPGTYANVVPSENQAYAPPQYRVEPAYPYAYPYARPSRRDRDGDGVPNRSDRYPDNPYRR